MRDEGRVPEVGVAEIAKEDLAQVRETHQRPVLPHADQMDLLGWCPLTLEERGEPLWGHRQMGPWQVQLAARPDRFEEGAFVIGRRVTEEHPLTSFERSRGHRGNATR